MGNMFEAEYYAPCCTAELNATRAPSLAACLNVGIACVAAAPAAGGSGQCSGGMVACFTAYVRCVLQAAPALYAAAPAAQCPWAAATVQAASAWGAAATPAARQALDIFGDCTGMGTSLFASAGCSVSNMAATCTAALSAPVGPPTAPAPALLNVNLGAGPAPQPAGMNYVVIHRGGCATCERPYVDGACACPSNTRVRTLSAFLPSYPFEQGACRRLPQRYDFCHSSTDNTTQVDFFVEELGGSRRCVTPHSAGQCACPEPFTNRTFRLPVPSGASETPTPHLVSICAPAVTNVYIAHELLGTCHQPLPNTTCGCLQGSSSTALPIAYINETTGLVTPGLLVLCSMPPRQGVTAQSIVTTTVTVTAGVTGGPSMAQIQGASVISLVDCSGSNNAADQGGRLVVTPVSITDERYGGLVFLLVVLLGVVPVHFAVGCVAALCSGIKQCASTKTASALPAMLRGISGQSRAKYESRSADVPSTTAAPATSTDCWTTLKAGLVTVWFPFESLLLLRLVYQGLAFESLLLLARPPTSAVGYALGAFGAVLCAVIVGAMAYVGVALQEECDTQFESFDDVLAELPAVARVVLPGGFWRAGSRMDLYGSTFTLYGPSAPLVRSFTLPFVQPLVIAIAVTVPTPREHCDAMLFTLFALIVCFAIAMLYDRPHRYPTDNAAFIALSILMSLMIVGIARPDALNPASLYLAVIYCSLLFAFLHAVAIAAEFLYMHRRHAELQVVEKPSPVDVVSVTPAESTRSDAAFNGVGSTGRSPHATASAAGILSEFPLPLGQSYTHVDRVTMQSVSDVSSDHSDRIGGLDADELVESRGIAPGIVLTAPQAADIE